MANPIGIFFSRLAPEDKHFIKRILIILAILLLVTVASLLIYNFFIKKEDTTSAINATSSESTENTFELPPVPEVPEISADSTTATTDSTEEQEMQSDSLIKLAIPAIIEEYVPDFNDDEYFEENSHLELMRQNVEKYNFKLALKHGARITEFLLANTELTAEWGHVLLEAGKPLDAIPVLQKAVSGGMNNTEVLTDLAFALLRNGQASEAITFLNESLIGNNNVDLLAAKAAVLMEAPDTNMRKDANEIFLKIANSKSDKADYWYGRFLMQNGDFQKSKTYLEQAVKAKPKEPRYIARLGMADFYLKQDASAEALYKKALSINPYDYNTWYNLGELYYSKANESSDASKIRTNTHLAMQAYINAIENDSLHASAHYRVGLLQNLNGAHKEAIKHLRITLEKNPKDIPSMLQLSTAYIQLGDTVQSIDYLNSVLQLDPFNRIAASEKKRIEKR